MGLVDQAKAIRSAFEERVLPHPVVFHHVPKCGGTSVGRALRQRYLLSQATVKPEESFRAFEAFTGRADREEMLVDVLDLREQMMLYHLFDGVACVSLHVRFSETAHRLFKDRYRFVTILREPVERFVSHYFWSHGKTGAHGRIEEDFEPFLETERARRLGATYAEFYSGLPKEADIRSNEAIDRAVDNLAKFDVVGRLDELSSFETGLKNALGTKIRIGHENKGHRPRSSKAGILTPAVRERVEALCAPDIAVWNAGPGNTGPGGVQ